MKPTTNNATSESERIEAMLYERGFHSMVEWYGKVDSIGAFIMKYVPLIIIVIRLGISIYYYPRSIQYLFAHPLTELTYLINSLGLYFYLALGVFFAVAIISYIIRKILADKASNIYYQVYNEIGIEAPKFEI